LDHAHLNNPGADDVGRQGDWHCDNAAYSGHETYRRRLRYLSPDQPPYCALDIAAAPAQAVTRQALGSFETSATLARSLEKGHQYPE